MSLKPTKKGDLNKSWMQPRRDRHKMIQPEYHLIVSEGTETEPLYFKSMGEIINRNYPDRIHIHVEGKGDNTLSLYSKAKHLAEGSTNGYRHVWVVFDTDDFPASHIDETARLCEADSNAETTYHAIWSNQCVELWFLLHFSFMQSDLHRSEYWPKLTSLLNIKHDSLYLYFHQSSPPRLLRSSFQKLTNPYSAKSVIIRNNLLISYKK